VDAGGAAYVVGGAAGSGCVAVGNRICCAAASSANVASKAAAVSRTSGFNGVPFQSAGKVLLAPRAQTGRGAGLNSNPRDFGQLQRMLAR
jgi:hypothetical protein